MPATYKVEDYKRALKLEPALRALEALVDTLGSLVRPKDRLCYGCAWEQVIKPLVSPLVGWGREGPGYIRTYMTKNGWNHQMPTTQ